MQELAFLFKKINHLMHNIYNKYINKTAVLKNIFFNSSIFVKCSLL